MNFKVVSYPDFHVFESMQLCVSELFDNYMQQDAHEFLNYLLNTVADLLQGGLGYAGPSIF